MHVWREILDWYYAHGYTFVVEALEARLDGQRRPREVLVDLYDLWHRNPASLLQRLQGETP